MFIPTQNILSATSSCHLSLSAVMLAASVSQTDGGDVLLYSRTCTLMTRALKSLSFRPVGVILCLKTTVRMMWSAAFA